MAIPQTEKAKLLSDDEVLAFITHGYHIVIPKLADGLNDEVCRQIDAAGKNTGNGILDAAPAIKDVFAHPEIQGALISLLGRDFQMNGHRHLHINPPDSRSQGWHQDGTNVRHHQIWCVLAMYYPHDVPIERGPTVVMPGTHFRNAPTDRLQTYANIKGQVPLAVKAGTVAIAHYDLWHAASLNRTDCPRYMLKLLFDRKTPPDCPSWDHTPDATQTTAPGRIREQVGPQGYCSDYYKEWELRTEIWQWMLGDTAPVPPGAFKNMLA